MSHPYHHREDDLNYPSLHTSTTATTRHQNSPHSNMGFNQDHLEDFDSQIGDIESRCATQNSASTRHEILSQQLEDSVKRGIRNATQAPTEEEQRLQNVSSRTPGGFLHHIIDEGGGGYSVTTGSMEEMMDDTYTFDGSTITSVNDISHKKWAPARMVVQFPHHPQEEDEEDENGNQYASDLAFKPTHSTENTSYSSHFNDPKRNNSFTDFTEKKTSKKNKKSASTVSTLCCGLGKVGIILVSVAVILMSVAFILWLVLGLIPSSSQQQTQQQSQQQEQDATTITPQPPLSGETPTTTTTTANSACCLGDFEPGWAGKEICTNNDCCVVCASSIVETESPNDTMDNEVTTFQPTFGPPSTTLAPTTLPALATLPPTPNPTTLPPTTPAPTTAPPTTLAPTLAPTTKCCTNSLWGDFIGYIRCIPGAVQDCCQVCAP